MNDYNTLSLTNRTTTRAAQKAMRDRDNSDRERERGETSSHTHGTTRWRERKRATGRGSMIFFAAGMVLGQGRTARSVLIDV